MPNDAAGGRGTNALRVAGGGAIILLALGGIAWLWSAYGTAVFFETIRAGFIACFG